MSERRSSKRVPVHLEARVVCDTSSSCAECTIRDISSTGARLVFPCLAEIPVEFVLRIPGTDAAARSRLIWSTGQENGIMFTDRWNRQPASLLPLSLSHSAGLVR